MPGYSLPNVPVTQPLSITSDKGLHAIDDVPPVRWFWASWRHPCRPVVTQMLRKSCNASGPARLPASVALCFCEPAKLAGTGQAEEEGTELIAGIRLVNPKEVILVDLAEKLPVTFTKSRGVAQNGRIRGPISPAPLFTRGKQELQCSLFDVPASAGDVISCDARLRVQSADQFLRAAKNEIRRWTNRSHRGRVTCWPVLSVRTAHLKHSLHSSRN